MQLMRKFYWGDVLLAFGEQRMLAAPTTATWGARRDQTRPAEIAARRWPTLAVALTVALLIVAGVPFRAHAQRSEETRAGVVQIQHLLFGARGGDPNAIRSSCGTRVEAHSSGTTTAWSAVCTSEPGAEPRTVDCHERLRAAMAPVPGLEIGFECEGFFLFSDETGRILADLGTVDMLWNISTVRLLHDQESILQPWIQFGGDGGYDLLLAWDPAVSMFRIIFFAYRAHGLAIRVPTSARGAEIENCEGVWRWSASHFRFDLVRRNPNARRDCDDGL